MRKMARIAKINAVGSPRRCPDVGVAVEHCEAIALLEGAAGPGGGSCSGNVERSFRNFLDRRYGRILLKQLEAPGLRHRTTAADRHDLRRRLWNGPPAASDRPPH